MIPSPTNRPKSPKGQPELLARDAEAVRDIYIEMKLLGVGGRRNRQTHLAKAETQDDGKAKVAAHQSLPGAHQGQHTGTQEY